MGLGRSARWRVIPFDSKSFEPKFLIEHDRLASNQKCYLRPKLAHRQVARSTDSRTMISCVISGFGCGYKLPTLSFSPDPLREALWFSGVLNTFTFDYITRVRHAGTDLAWNALADLPVPARQ